MTREEVLKKLNELFIDEFDDDDICIDESMTAEDIEDWDSLANMNLIVAIEHTFQIKFNINEVSDWKNVGDMLSVILEKLENE